MRLILMALFITLPFFSFAQGFKIKIGEKEFASDKVPEDDPSFPDRVNKFSIKKDKAHSNPNTNFILLIGEEERSFPADEAYHEVEFSHDIRDLVCYILDEKRGTQGKWFKLKKRK